MDLAQPEKSVQYTHEMTFHLGVSTARMVRRELGKCLEGPPYRHHIKRVFIDDDQCSIAQKHWQLDWRRFYDGPRQVDQPAPLRWKLTHRPCQSGYGQVCEDEEEIIRLLGLSPTKDLRAALSRKELAVLARVKGQRLFYDLGGITADITDYQITPITANFGKLLYPLILEISAKGNSPEEMDIKAGRMEQLSKSLGLTTQAPNWRLFTAREFVKKGLVAAPVAA